MLDMEAGLEHMGRGTTEGMDQFIVVIEPGCKKCTDLQECKTSGKRSRCETGTRGCQ